MCPARDSAAFSEPCPWASSAVEYAQGELDGEELRRFRSHAEDCAECSEAVEDLSSRLEALRSSSASLEDGFRPSLSGRVLARIQSRRRARWQRSSLAAAMLFAAAGLFMFLQLRNPEEPSAVAHAVEWLVAVQEEDGSWNPERWTGETQNRPGVSGLVLLALARSDANDARPAVEKGTRYLLGEQRPSGLIGPESDATLASQSVCTLALLESYARTRDARTKAGIDRALDGLLKLSPPAGSWGAPGALEVWTLETLQRARDLGWSGVSGLLARVQDQASRRLGSLPGASGSPMYQATAVLLLQESAGRPSAQERRAMDVVARSLYQRRTASDAYTCYFLARVPLAPEGAAIRARLGELQRQIADRQVSSGELAGSWDPEDGLGAGGGRLSATALAALSLSSVERAGVFSRGH